MKEEECVPPEKTSRDGQSKSRGSADNHNSNWETYIQLEQTGGGGVKTGSDLTMLENMLS